jgi:branched-chain amino acid transport system substrate-binding protein
MAGKKIHFVGATGDLNFSDSGRVNALAYDIWQHQADGTAKVIKTLAYKPQ